MTQDQFEDPGPSGVAIQRAAAPEHTRGPIPLGPMPSGRAMEIVDEVVVRAPLDTIFALARHVEHWPAYLSHYRWVRFYERASDGGGVVGMSAWRPFGVVGWPTWWKSEMTVDAARPAIRFLHIGGITTGMDVEWTFVTEPDAVRVRIVHVWDGPRWPLVGVLAATSVIGPVFIHGIASRTLKGLAAVAERGRRR
ncbi:MAG: SRPBCC family protein [Gemmatimonadaceae bacterium]